MLSVSIPSVHYKGIPALHNGSETTFNHLMVVHVHRELTDKLNLTAVANEFVSGSEHRSTLFRTFEPSDLLH